MIRSLGCDGHGPTLKSQPLIYNDRNVFVEDTCLKRFERCECVSIEPLSCPFVYKGVSVCFLRGHCP